VTKIRDHNGKIEPFTRVPNRLFRSNKLSMYDKMVYIAVASCDPSFPSYEKIAEWTGMSRDSVWKSLRRLEEKRIIIRATFGRGVKYKLYCFATDKDVNDPMRKTFANSLPGGLVDDLTSLPDGL
jgi:biotin operon repressor